MFAIVQNETVVKTVQPGVAFEWDNISYPSNWCNLSTAEEKAAIGMVDVIYSQRANERYYWVTQNAPVYNTETRQVEVNYTNTPKDLAVLKSELVALVKEQTNNILSRTSWLLERFNDPSSGKPVPQNVLDYRAATRALCNTYEAQINAATSVDDLAVMNLQFPEIT